MESRIAAFKRKAIRKTIRNDEWWFAIVDVIEILTGSERPPKYWNDLKKKLLDGRIRRVVLKNRTTENGVGRRETIWDSGFLTGC